MTVLVLCEDLDPAADKVISQLHSRQVPVFRCDLSWFPQQLALEGRLEDGHWDGVLRTPHRQVRLREVRSIWYRHPSAFRFPDTMTTSERRHSTHEARLAFGGILWSLPVLWLNHPARQADTYKPLQLTVAAGCGLSVPATLITNRAPAVNAFARAYPGGVVLKQLGFASISETGGRRALFTRLLTGDDLADLSGVEHTAHTFQEWIAKRFDARVTVVGGNLFSAAIYSGSASGRVDFRADYGSLSYDAIHPPAAVVAGIRSFMRHFGLAFAAFDFAVDHDGVWWFLECNPGGQYGFIEQATGLPISEALSHLLESGLT